MLESNSNSIAPDPGELSSAEALGFLKGIARILVCAQGLAIDLEEIAAVIVVSIGSRAIFCSCKG